MADFDDIAQTLKCHFCKKCKASFECDDEDGYCDCPFADYLSEDTCDTCLEAYLDERDREQKEYEEERRRERDEEDDD